MSSNGIVVSSGDLSGLSNQGRHGNCLQCSKDIPFTTGSNFQGTPDLTILINLLMRLQFHYLTFLEKEIKLGD